MELMGNAKTGISGLDEILSGGLARGHVFLLEGEPGAGKTTVAVQFVLEGAKAGERSLYILFPRPSRNFATERRRTAGP